eukprot:gnl/MRDRNA2_/MRDRNA2_35361_c0_seq1.p1 gnl/MRDRNA2_/MRDRNA2_35361_c0~~gnl/MRDRNA2_/MRDRNA2_35361_c0_seq1.p1  ORF type:complete len:235 (+),score=80.95 gnl/MRDRNA2_/MRDRNA2_35361_c0_seq1:95-706(+)
MEEQEKKEAEDKKREELQASLYAFLKEEKKKGKTAEELEKALFEKQTAEYSSRLAKQEVKEKSRQKTQNNKEKPSELKLKHADVPKLMMPKAERQKKVRLQKDQFEKKQKAMEASFDRDMMGLEDDEFFAPDKRLRKKKKVWRPVGRPEASSQSDPEASLDVISIHTATLIGFFQGTAVTFGVLRLCRATSTTSSEAPLDANS